MNTHALLRATVRSILDRAVDLEWSLQGFGMLRHYLTPTVRLHIWDSRFKVKDVSTIHDHPWDFRSYIVSGLVRQHRYSEIETQWDRTTHPYARLYERTKIRCGPGGCSMGDPQHVTLLRGPIEAYEAGRWYEQRAEEIHESLPHDGTVTLVEHHFKTDTEHARVYHQTPQWVSAEPRQATREEIAAFVRRALHGWSA